MTVVIKSKDELVVPRSVHRKAGFKTGDRVEFKVSSGVINIVPELPSADDEYTPAERLAIDARLAGARKGLQYGPFKNAEEAIGFLRREIKARKTNSRGWSKRGLLTNRPTSLAPRPASAPRFKTCRACQSKLRRSARTGRLEPSMHGLRR